MMNKNLSIRKPPIDHNKLNAEFPSNEKQTLPLTQNSIHHTEKDEDYDSDDFLNVREPHNIFQLRSLNPNLQPLSASQRNDLRKSNRRSTDDMFLRQPDTRSLNSSGLNAGGNRSQKSSSEVPSDIRRRKSMWRKPTFLRNPGDSSKLIASTQNFWKYHILQVGKDIYLTTNPDSKHLYCRNAPSVYIQIEFPISKVGANGRTKSNFTLIFKDAQNEEEFMTVHKIRDQITLLAKSWFCEDNEGTISVGYNGNPHTLIANKTEVDEIAGMRPDELIAFEPIQYHVIDLQNKNWKIGSLPTFKSNLKLKNKRFIYYQDVKSTSILAAFRPNEINKRRKALVKKIDRSVKSLDVSKYYERTEGNQDANLLSSIKDDAYYSAADGINTLNPPDDAPNSDKLGWLTIYDQPDHLMVPGKWESVLGFTLAVAYSQILDKRTQIYV
ncbi:hypothetical protein WICMUC_004351 [Wickerhamomyces mucosus]|uniref:Tubby C-terminal domain-containing protein n=1 Tax=Wickerhamomyces mucosus TaxID=1378264 RepID=A0A9P8TAT6_9ASCO|nr:hypothetical protein WICMUC_004351 [Wickerhamomyces mucosus]